MLAGGICFGILFCVRWLLWGENFAERLCELSKLSTFPFIFPPLELTSLNLFSSGKNILEKKTSDKSFWRHSEAGIQGIFKSKFFEFSTATADPTALRALNKFKIPEMSNFFLILLQTQLNSVFIIIVWVTKHYFFSCVSKFLFPQWEELTIAR